MSHISFNAAKCQTKSQNKIFGICDKPSPNNEPAYVDEQNGQDWLAIVTNEKLSFITFTAIDNCIELFREDGKQDKQCDGVLTFDFTIIFIELKNRKPIGNSWVLDGERQLKRTINHFEQTEQANEYLSKKAYVANKQHPRFKSSQVRRMEQFLIDTGYVLRIENRITL